MRWLFLLCLLQCAGCAVSYVERAQSISATEPAQQSAPIKPLVSCPARLMGMMVSPLIPLPPIFPVGLWPAEKQVAIAIPIENGITLQHAEVKRKDAHLLPSAIGEPYDYQDRTYARLTVQTSCAALDQSDLYVRYIALDSSEKEFHWLLQYDQGDLDFGWFYMR